MFCPKSLFVGRFLALADFFFFFYFNLILLHFLAENVLAERCSQLFAFSSENSPVGDSWILSTCLFL